MTVRTILQVGNPELRVPAKPVPQESIKSAEIQRVILDLVDTMRDANGAGLAATQVGIPWRICVIEVGENPRYPYKPKIPLTVLVNPKLTPLSYETFANYEGCLSVPNLRGVVHRHVGVRVEGFDQEGTPVDFESWGISAGTFQHEVDHLDGVVFVDRVRDPATFSTWQDFDMFHKEDFIKHVEGVKARFS